MGLLWGLLAILMAGCWVNKASIDPFAYAPECPCWYWNPDEKASALSCEKTMDCAEIPDEKCILSLSEVLDIALINNTQTQITWAQARVAAAEYGLSQSTAFPNISAEFYHAKSRTAYLASQVEQNVMQEVLIINDQSYWGPEGHLTWTLLDFGQRRYTSEAARYMLYFADYTHNQAVQTVLEMITLDYYNYLFQKKLLEANEADLANAEETLDAAELALRTGVKNISDVLQARTQALLAEIQLSEQHRAVNTAYATLLDDMGLPATATIQLQKLPFVDPDSADLDPLDEYLEIAMQCRPDLLAARAEVQSAEMSLKAASRQWTPVLDSSLDIGRTYYTGGFTDKYHYTLVFAVSMPIFTGFHIRNTINRAKARYEETEAQLQQQELSVIKDVSTAHYNVSVAFNTLKAAILFLKSAKEQYEVALSQYKVGVNTILDVTSAQASLFDARAKQARALEQWFNTLATLAYSAGILSPNPGKMP